MKIKKYDSVNGWVQQYPEVNVGAIVVSTDIDNLTGSTDEYFLRADGSWAKVETSGNQFVNITGDTMTGDLSVSRVNANGNISATRVSGATINMQAQASRGIIGTDSNHGLRLKTNATDRITIQTDGDVGIGTTTPAEKLDVNGSIQANNNFKFKGSGGYYLYNSSGTFRGGIIDDGGATKIYGDGNGSTPIITLDGGNIKTGGNLIFDDDANNSDYLIDFQEHPDGTYGAYIRYDGSASNALEIGTRNAGTETESIFIDRNTADVTFRQDVDVQGDFKIESVFPRIYLVDTNHNNDYSILNGNGYFGVYDDTAGLYRFKINSSGNAVIGDGNPSNLGFLEKSLEIQAGSSSDTTLKQAGLVISGSSDSDDSDDFAYLSFRNNHSTLSNDRVAELRIVKNGTNVDTADMKFYTANGTSLAARMTLTNDGKLGIGTELPSSTLEVVGDIRANRMYDRTNTSYYVDPASTSILYNIDVQNTTTTRGSVVVDTDTNQNLFYISRTGSTSQEYTSFGRDDTTTHIHTKNDESSSTIRFRIENTDTESGGGANANDRNIDFISDATRAQIQIAGQRVATENYVDTEISSLVASAPDALNTLNELAAALGDDENFSTTVTNNLAGKLNLTGGTLTGTLTSRSINMQNYTLSNVGQMTFNDPGPNEGISWSGGNFKIYESPNDLSTNTAGNLQFVSGGARRLTVQTDGTVYVPGTLKAEKVEIEGALFDVETNSLRMPLVKGGHYNSDTSSVTGAISIVLPTGTYANATMMNFFVDVFDYAGGSDGESFTIHIGGYNYTDGTWHNVFANLVSGRTDRFFTVRFNYDSTNSANIIYIAETTSNWAYPKVTVRDFSAGFSGADDADWYNNSFTVSITSTMFGTTSRSKTAENVASNSLQLGGVNASNYLRSDTSDTMTGDLTLSRNNVNTSLTINSGTASSIINMNGTGTSFIEKDTGNDLYIAHNVSDKNIHFRVNDGGTQNVLMTLNGSSSRVGIGTGTSNPSEKLEVEGAGIFNSNAGQRVLYLRQSSAGFGNIVQFQGASNQNVWELVGRDSHFYIYNNDLSKYAIYIEDSNNRIGINGHNTPSVELDVNGQIRAFSSNSAKIWSENTGGGQASLELKNSETHFRFIADNGGYSIYDQIDGAERFAIDTNGNSTIKGNLTITSAYPRIFLTDTDSNSDYSIINGNGTFSIYDDTNSAMRMQLNSSGDTTFSGAVVATDYLYAHANLLTKGNLYLNYDNNPSGADATIYFGDDASDTAHNLIFDNSVQRFKFSNAVESVGSLITHANLYLNYDNSPAGTDPSIYFGDDTADSTHYIQFDNSGQRFKTSNTLDVGGALTVNSNLYLNYDNSPTGADATIYFGDDTADSTHKIYFNNSAQTFNISDKIVGPAGRLGAIESNGSDVDKVNFSFNSSTNTLTITTTG